MCLLSVVLYMNQWYSMIASCHGSFKFVCYGETVRTVVESVFLVGSETCKKSMDSSQTVKYLEGNGSSWYRQSRQTDKMIIRVLNFKKYQSQQVPSAHSLLTHGSSWKQLPETMSVHRSGWSLLHYRTLLSSPLLPDNDILIIIHSGVISIKIFEWLCVCNGSGWVLRTYVPIYVPKP